MTEAAAPTEPTAEPAAPPAGDWLDSLDIPASEPFASHAAPDPGTTDSPPQASPQTPAPQVETPPGPVSAPPPSTPALAQPTEHTVPVGVLVAERRRFQDELAAAKARLAELEAAARAPAAPTETPAEPDYLDDPKGYIDSARKAAEAAKAAAQAATAKAQEAVQAQEIAQAQQRFVADVQASEQQFLAQTPDYEAALNHVRQGRAAQMRALYPQATNEQLGEALRREELSLAFESMRQGRNPAEVVYQFARSSGYQPPTPATPSAPTGGPASPPAAPGKVTSLDAARAAAAATLGSGGDSGEPAEDGGEDPLDAVLRERMKRR